jgi:VanZ family protein
MRNTSRRVWILAAAVCTLWIWSNSFWPATQSASQSRHVLEFLTPLLEHFPTPNGGWHNLIRKLAHMSEYALLGILWTQFLASGGHRRIQNGFPWAMLVCVVTPFLDESIQLFSPGRSAEIVDVWIDILGVLCGVIFTLIVRAVISHFRRNR